MYESILWWYASPLKFISAAADDTLKYVPYVGGVRKPIKSQLWAASTDTKNLTRNKFLGKYDDRSRIPSLMNPQDDYTFY
ncbi:hypothetical protein TNCT_281661 [Trichonephila clavata]|uniref:Uncharacterized protein n=1 Tax=Trichonephila clavata TaxID=2740835 RepID=A0A8X6KUK7_TRICU|nr:hypothetical protein TNCT_281661 [Trichonephila clavata]